jgi:hypothetical protein
MENSVLQLIIDWAQKSSTIDGLAIRGIYDVLKYGSKSLWNNIERFFISEKEGKEFLETIQSKQVDSQINLEEHIKLIFNEVCNRSLSPQDNIELLNEIKSWLITAATSQTSNNANVKVYQKAGRDIFNVQGTLNIKKNIGD